MVAWSGSGQGWLPWELILWKERQGRGAAFPAPRIQEGTEILSRLVSSGWLLVPLGPEGVGKEKDKEMAPLEGQFGV